MPRRNSDPYLAFSFIVELDMIQIAAFNECSGLDIETQTTTYVEGGRNDTTLVFPNTTSHGNITLKRGLTAPNHLLAWQLWDWQQDMSRGQFDINPRTSAQNIAIVLQDENGNTVKRWNLNRVLPVKWSGPDLKADASQVAIETLVLAHEGITVDQITGVR